jgi:hypothetical protein
MGITDVCAFCLHVFPESEMDGQISVSFVYGHHFLGKFPFLYVPLHSNFLSEL